MDINDFTISKADINQTLTKIRSISSQTKAHPLNTTESVNKPQFNTLLSLAKNAINQVNESQMNTASIKNAYLAGDPNTSVSQVMIASVKSKVAFEGLTAVRNKMIDFYKEIMNMPI